jgi:ATP-dependent exoDNAse (exonuclease V) alpha subunit
VLLIVSDRISPLLTRELHYTALTRAKSRATWLAAVPDVLVQAAGQRVWRSGGLGIRG